MHTATADTAQPGGTGVPDEGGGRCHRTGPEFSGRPHASIEEEK